MISLADTIRAEVAARRVWLHTYPHENMLMLRWVLS